MKELFEKFTKLGTQGKVNEEQFKLFMQVSKYYEEAKDNNLKNKAKELLENILKECE